MHPLPFDSPRPDRLLVTGGSGFIGHAICRQAVLQGCDVVSLSRRGRPAGSASWMDAVTWHAADIMDLEAWRDLLPGCQAVIHCVGIIREDRKQNITFERINGEAAVLVADAAEQAGVPAFVFLSAADTPPLVPERFLMAKRRAEAHLRQSSLRTAILRPLFVYGRGRPATLIPGTLLEGTKRLPLLRRRLESIRPLPVEQVAAAAVYAARAPYEEGTFAPEAIQRLARTLDPTLAQASASGTSALLAAAALTGLAAAFLWKNKQPR